MINAEMNEIRREKRLKERKKERKGNKNEKGRVREIKCKNERKTERWKEIR